MSETSFVAHKVLGSIPAFIISTHAAFAVSFKLQLAITNTTKIYTDRFALTTRLLRCNAG
jgi:hypothetical protein